MFGAVLLQKATGLPQYSRIPSLLTRTRLRTMPQGAMKYWSLDDALVTSNGYHRVVLLQRCVRAEKQRPDVLQAMQARPTGVQALPINDVLKVAQFMHIADKLDPET
jgi:hypothetical protein